MVRRVHPLPPTFAPTLSIMQANLAALMALLVSLKAVPLSLMVCGCGDRIPYSVKRGSAVSSSAFSPEALQHDLIHFNAILYELIMKSGNNKERNWVVVQRNWLGF